MAEGAAQVLYRIVQTDPPTFTDFLSNAAQGLEPRGAALRQPELWSGLSMFGSVELAYARARRFPRLGQYVATVRILDEESVVSRQTLGEGHYTVWGEPKALLGAVIKVEPVPQA